MKIGLKKRLAQTFGVQVVRNPHRGIELYHDVVEYLPSLQIGTVFDVGANVGASALAYREWYAEASIHCFEPVSSTFNLLRKNTNQIRNIHYSKAALGAFTTTAYVSTNETESYLNRIELAGADSAEPADRALKDSVEKVEVSTVDQYCRDNGVDSIELLKVDTEGHDQEVIDGASEMLKEHRISLIQTECGMNPGNDWHVPLEKLKSRMESRGYYVFGLYEQVGEWKTNQPHLRRVNAVFLSENLM